MKATLILAFWWSFVWCAVSASSFRKIVSDLKGRKANLETCLTSATAAFKNNDEVDLEALEQLSLILFQKRLNFRKCNSIIHFSKALAKYSTKNGKEIAASNIQLLRTALLLNATFTSSQECPDHEEALSILVASLQTASIKEKFISESVNSVQLSSFILPKKLIFTRNFLSFETLASLFDSYILSILQGYEWVDEISHEHLFELANCIFEADIHISVNIFIMLFSFFQEKLAALRECGLFKAYIKFLIRYFPDIVDCDCERCAVRAKRFIVLLICNETLSLLSEEDHFYAGLLFFKLKLTNNQYFTTSQAVLTTGQAFMERLKEKEPLNIKVEKLLKLLSVNDEKYDELFRARIKHGAILKLQPIIENPSNVFLIEPVKRVLLRTIFEFKNGNEHEFILCYIYAASSLLLKFPLIPETKFPLSLNSIKTLGMMINLKKTNAVTEMSVPYIALINDSFIEELFNNFKGFSKTLSDEQLFMTDNLRASCPC